MIAIDSILQTIEQQKIISIIRTSSDYDLSKTVESLYAGGIRVIEVTMNSPGALQEIEKIKGNFPDVLVGAGTVLDAETARLAILSGASFLLAPTLSKNSIQLANRYNVPLIPGVFTPTEVLQAYEYGAKVVKVFPVGTLGPKYIKELKGPLSQVEMIPVGGVTEQNAKAFIQAGSFALGVGSSLVSDKLVREENYPEIEKRAKQLVAAISSSNL